MALTIEEKVKAYLNGPMHYSEGLILLQEISPKRRLLAKMIKASKRRGSPMYIHYREKVIHELNLYLKGPRPGYGSVTDYKENFHH